MAASRDRPGLRVLLLVCGVFVTIAVAIGYFGLRFWRTQTAPSMGLAVAVAFGSAFAAMLVSMLIAVLTSGAPRSTGPGAADLRIRSRLPAIWLLVAGGSMSFVAVHLLGARRVPLQGAILIGLAGLVMAGWAGRAWPRKR